jgi:bifunctional non-homologous end joining protein LigD
VHEIKFDGYRAQLHKRNSGTKMFTRRGHDWSDRFRNIVVAAGELTRTALSSTASSSSRRQKAGRTSGLESALARKGGPNDLVFYPFDIMHLEIFDLRACTLLDRKRVLHALIENVKGPIKYSEHLEEDGPDVFHNACELELEGVVSKRVDGKYSSDRTDTWLETTCRMRETFVAVGWAEKAGKFDGLYLGRRERGKLVYAGKLERGFNEVERMRIMALFSRLKTKEQPVTAGRNFPKARWVKPEVLVDAEFRGKTGDGLLRHPAFKGVRQYLME